MSVTRRTFLGAGAGVGMMAAQPAEQPQAAKLSLAEATGEVRAFNKNLLQTLQGVPFGESFIVDMGSQVRAVRSRTSSELVDAAWMSEVLLPFCNRLLQEAVAKKKANAPDADRAVTRFLLIRPYVDFQKC